MRYIFASMPKVPSIRAGMVLIAEPFLADPNFSRAVVYLVEHNEEGTLGFVLNQPMGIMLKDVVEAGPEDQLDIPLYIGGPVASSTLHVIHQLGDHIQDSKYVGKHIYWGGDFEQIKFLLGNKNARWNDFRFFVGYSGWGSGQLQEELENGSWIVNRTNDEFIFDLEKQKIWEAALTEKGGKFKLLKDSPLSPDWN